MYKVRIEYMDKENVEVTLEDKEVALFCQGLKDGKFCDIGKNAFFTDPSKIRYVYVQRPEMDSQKDEAEPAEAMGEEPAPADGDASPPA